MFHFYFIKKIKVAACQINTGHHCYDFEYEIKSEFSQFKFYCLVINDGCLFSPQIDSNR